jgi:hypothetical protein
MCKAHFTLSLLTLIANNLRCLRGLLLVLLLLLLALKIIAASFFNTLTLAPLVTTQLSLVSLTLFAQLQSCKVYWERECESCKVSKRLPASGSVVVVDHLLHVCVCPWCWHWLWLVATCYCDMCCVDSANLNNNNNKNESVRKGKKRAISHILFLKCPPPPHALMMLILEADAIISSSLFAQLSSEVDAFVMLRIIVAGFLFIPVFFSCFVLFGCVLLRYKFG